MRKRLIQGIFFTGLFTVAVMTFLDCGYAVRKLYVEPGLKIERIEMAPVYPKESRALVPGSWGEYHATIGEYFDSQYGKGRLVMGIVDVDDEQIVWETVSYFSSQLRSRMDNHLDKSGYRDLHCATIKNEMTPSNGTTSITRNQGMILQYHHICVEEKGIFPEAIVIQCMKEFGNTKGDQNRDFFQTIESAKCFGRALPDGSVIPLDISLEDLQKGTYKKAYIKSIAPIPNSLENTIQTIQRYQEELQLLGDAYKFTKKAIKEGLKPGSVMNMGFSVMAYAMERNIYKSAAKEISEREPLKIKSETIVDIGDQKTIKTIVGEITVRPLIRHKLSEWTVEVGLKKSLLGPSLLKAMAPEPKKEIRRSTSTCQMFYSEYAPVFGLAYMENTVPDEKSENGSRIVSAMYLTSLGLNYQSKIDGMIEFNE